ncbi:MAG: response regulator transcription factor [Magnetococcales bacterium]|nr:response regulator transcription factor [Magnetococcales bacterium]
MPEETSKKTVLLVDDDPNVHLLFSTVIQGMGYEVVGEARDGKEGLQMFQEKAPDLVLLDIHMPVMDGIEALKKILAADPNARVVMLTTLHNMDIYEECLLLGAKRYIPKDTPMMELRNRISEAIE